MKKEKIKSPLDSVVYIKIPEHLLKKFSHHIIEKDLLIPVQLPDGVLKVEDFDVSLLTTEMILSGMLIVFAHKRTHKNIEHYRKLFTEIRPNIKDEMLKAITIKIQNKDYVMAESLLDSLIGFDEKDLNIPLTKAYLYEEMGKEDIKHREKASAIYDYLIGVEPPFPPVFFNAAIFFIEEKNYKRAKDLLETYVALKIDDEDDISKVEKAQEALNYLNSQIIDDENFQKAIELINKDRIDDALVLIQKFMSDNPKKWNGWFLLGWALRKAKRWADGVMAFRKCIELYKQVLISLPSSLTNEYSEMCNELAICLMENGNIKEAEEVLIDALATDCENVKLISNLGVIALKKGDEEKAIAYFRTVLFILPHDEVALSMLRNLES
ncbi:MAG: tetratricopeptide repeat protein [Treponema sp.]